MPLVAGQWTLITQTVSLGLYQVFIDGQLVGTQNFQTGYLPELMHSPSWLTVGGGGTGGQFVGGMADFQLFDSVLTPAQIAALYLSGETQAGTFSPNSPVQLASGAAMDLGGVNQTVASLSDGVGGGGTGDQ